MAEINKAEIECILADLRDFLMEDDKFGVYNITNRFLWIMKSSSNPFACLVGIEKGNFRLSFGSVFDSSDKGEPTFVSLSDPNCREKVKEFICSQIWDHVDL